MTKISADPRLYEVNEDGLPVLTGIRDSGGFISYPVQDAGSLSNGDHGPDLTPVTLSGRGQITATATVRLHPGPGIETPFTVASILLEEGPLVRGILDADDRGCIGDTVVATTTAVPRGEDEVYELRFRTTEKESKS
ncbi:OB-fold domain-containing protein [Rhodococcus sp. OK302]|uniref:OB-fold domain-containing protein n=1 Tax=Rhodococcus sp. OK302 TaxID=1882769 RepID=UPI000B9430F9|nr:hypothetical protein [Rhodococcus sp. OK302]OYD70356.1 hypothetical protein BDB13_3964 [Rhodococcus sp. OK302]